jgi:hypothetical protein
MPLKKTASTKLFSEIFHKPKNPTERKGLPSSLGNTTLSPTN